MLQRSIFVSNNVGYEIGDCTYYGSFYNENA